MYVDGKQYLVEDTFIFCYLFLHHLIASRMETILSSLTHVHSTIYDYDHLNSWHMLNISWRDGGTGFEIWSTNRTDCRLA